MQDDLIAPAALPYKIVRGVFNSADINYAIKNAIVGTDHHGEEDGHGHGDGGHASEAAKINHFPHFASRIREHLFNRQRGLLAVGLIAVDPWFKLYKLNPTAAGVPPHKDNDFVREYLFATWSVLVFLSDDYTGGETVFNSKEICPHLSAGDLLVFPHDLLHADRPVLRGEKIVLKTDLLFRN